MIRFRPTVRRTAAVPVVLGAILALAAFTYPGGLACAYDDLRNMDEYRAQMDRSRIESNHYDASIVNFADRLALKEQIIGDLIRGHMALPEATRRFMDLNSSSDIARESIESGYRGDSYEEKSARNVIEFAKGQLTSLPAPSNTLQRIEGQFRAMFGKAVSAR